MTIYTLMLLHGTEFKDPEYRKRFGYEGKFRIVPLNYGEYDSVKVFDYEEVAIQTDSTSFQDYLDLRGMALFIESLINGRPFDELFSYAEKFGISRTKVLKVFKIISLVLQIKWKSYIKNLLMKTIGF